AQPHARADSRGRIRGFATRVARTDDDYVEGGHDGGLLADAEPLENVGEEVVARSTSGNLFERGTSLLQVGQQEFLVHWSSGVDCRVARTPQSLVRAFQQRGVADVRDFGSIALQIDVERADHGAPQLIEPLSCGRRDVDSAGGAVRGRREIDFGSYDKVL